MPDGLAGQNGSNVTTGAPTKADNTGRDWGEGAAIGAAAVGTIVGSILSWGTASPALIAGDAALTSAVIASDAAKDVQENKTDAEDQQRQQQAALDREQAARTPSPSPVTAPIKSLPIPSSPPPAGMAAPKPMPQPALPMQQPQAPQPPQQAAAMTSDKRAKENIKSGNESAADFLSLVRARGAWPKHLKDPKA